MTTPPRKGSQIMSNSGLFITFEGGEGSGKTTQINLLAKALSTKGHKVLTTREPGGTSEAEKIRNLLVQRDGGNWSPMAETLLLLAARSMHVDHIIRPALEEGIIVISDRFSDSTLAYQGYGHGFSKDKIQTLSIEVLDNFKPDLTFILDIDPKEGLKRSGRRLAAETLNIEQMEDRFENLDISFHESLRKGFLDIAKNEPERCRVLNALEDIEALAQHIKTCTFNRLGEGV